MKKMKERMLETVWMCMEEIRSNIEMSSDKDDVVANAKAISILADAYKTIRNDLRW